MPHSGHFLGKRNAGNSPFRSAHFDANHVRDDFACLLDHHHVAHADVLALDLLGVVQARPADDRAGQLDGLQVGHRRDRPGLADLHADARHAGCGLVLLELVGDDPPRGLRCGPEPVALVVTVHLEHQPVDLEIQLVQPLDEPLAMVGGRLEAGEACRAGRGGDAVVGAFAATPPAAPAKASPFGDDAGVDLAEMFGELKQDLESDVASADEDPETHYNLGIAFREMGLLDEAIGELQKACQSFDRGHPFPQIMQTYTWLAQCFLDKGVPEASVRWYDKALNVPGIDGETRVALHYEMASAYEACGDKPSALQHFTTVYSSNIDYRDVAERVKALKS